MRNGKKLLVILILLFLLLITVVFLVSILINNLKSSDNSYYDLSSASDSIVNSEVVKHYESSYDFPESEYHSDEGRISTCKSCCKC